MQINQNKLKQAYEMCIILLYSIYIYLPTVPVHSGGERIANVWNFVSLTQSKENRTDRIINAHYTTLF